MILKRDLLDRVLDENSSGTFIKEVAHRGPDRAGPFSGSSERLVNATLAEQKLAVSTFPNRSEDLFSIVVDVDPIDVHPGSYYVADRAIAKIENPLE